jgi:salicylate hydroxylase
MGSINSNKMIPTMAEKTVRLDFLPDSHEVSEYPTNSLKILQRLSSRTQNYERASRMAQLPKRILIVGAGLGGLAASIALARRGHEVTVLEKAAQLGEV